MTDFLVAAAIARLLVEDWFHFRSERVDVPSFARRRIARDPACLEADLWAARRDRRARRVSGFSQRSGRRSRLGLLTGRILGTQSNRTKAGQRDTGNDGQDHGSSKHRGISLAGCPIERAARTANLSHLNLIIPEAARERRNRAGADARAGRCASVDAHRDTRTAH